LRILQKIFQASAWIRYKFSGKNLHGLHSPFVYRWYQNLIDTEKEYYCFSRLRDLRNEMQLDTSKINIVDFGAGSSMMNSKSKKISQILSHSVKGEQAAQRLFKMVDMAQPKIVLELGTSLGITTAYLASACVNAKVYTLEGSPELYDLARKNHLKLGLKNIVGLQGEFESNLNLLLSQNEPIDFVFLDGNHQMEATLNYWKMLLPKLGTQAVVVFDDIHWSEGMERAWQSIVKSSQVSISIDLYDMGVVFLNKEFEKQHFTLLV